MEIECKICGKLFKRYGKQIKNAHTCSIECSANFRKSKPNTTCTQCGVGFHLKESSKKRYKRSQGYFCSTKCVANFRKKEYLGENNPNFRENVTTDGGYKLDYLPKFGRIKLHHKIVFETLNINKLPEGYITHHRDCNINNNDPNNLVLITPSDHRWLHKQFGNATLWAYYNGRVTLDELIVWSNNKKKTEKLLPLNIPKQKNEF